MEVINNGTMHIMDTRPCRFVPDCVDDDFEATASIMECMKCEEDRLASFGDWPANMPQKPRDLARAGLFYTHIDDRVQCPFCYGVLKKWLPSDTPLSEHSKHFPQCRFIRGLDVGNVPINPPDVPSLNQLTHVNSTVDRRSTPFNIIPPHNTCIGTRSGYNQGSEYSRGNNTGSGGNSGGSSTEAVRNVCPTRIPADADLTKEDHRLATYTGWNKGWHQTPEQLARAGLYFFPSDEKPDRVKCAYCHGKLYNWQPGDDPWMEHAKCFPTCQYIKLCLGADTIRDLQTPGNGAIASRNVAGGIQVSTTSTVTSSTNPTVAPTQPSTTGTLHSRNPETLPNLQGYLSSEQVQAVLEMGFGEDLVTQTVEQCFRERPGDLPRAAELASMVMALEDTRAASVTDPDPIPHQNLMTTGNCQTHTNPTPKTGAFPASPETCRVSATAPRHGQPRKLNPPSSGQAWTGYRDPALNPEIIRKENTRLKDQYLCKVCFENQVRVTFTPCGHLACCGPCSMAMSECPICRTPISGCVRTFF